MPRFSPSSLTWTMSSTPRRAAVASRKAIMSLNFQVVSTCSRGKGSLPRIERLLGDVQHRAGILADRIEQHRALEFRHHLAHDEDRFGFKPAQMSGEAIIHRKFP